MKVISLIAIGALALTTTACIGNSNERRREAAFNACKDLPDEQSRVKCRKQKMPASKRPSAET